MPDLSFTVEGVEPIPFAVVPTLAFRLKIVERAGLDDEGPTPIASILLRCQIRIEPTKRQYQPGEQEGLRDLFGEPSRWGQTLRGMLWTHVSLIVPPFEGEALVDLPVPCTFDFNVASTKYFASLDGGEIPLCFLFSGTIFYATEDGTIQIEQISWETEADFRLPVEAWKGMMTHYYPNENWLSLHRDVFDRLLQYKTRRGLPTWERALESLLETAEAEAEEHVPT